MPMTGNDCNRCKGVQDRTSEAAAMVIHHRAAILGLASTFPAIDHMSCPAIPSIPPSPLPAPLSRSQTQCKSTQKNNPLTAHTEETISQLLRRGRERRSQSYGRQARKRVHHSQVARDRHPHPIPVLLLFLRLFVMIGMCICHKNKKQQSREFHGSLIRSIREDVILRNTKHRQATNWRSGEIKRQMFLKM